MLGISWQSKEWLASQQLCPKELVIYTYMCLYMCAHACTQMLPAWCLGIVYEASEKNCSFHYPSSGPHQPVVPATIEPTSLQDSSPAFVLLHSEKKPNSFQKKNILW